MKSIQKYTAALLIAGSALALPFSALAAVTDTTSPTVTLTSSAAAATALFMAGSLPKQNTPAELTLH